MITAYDLDAGQRRGMSGTGEVMTKPVNPKPSEFVTESDEALVGQRQRTAFLSWQKAPAKKRKGSALVAKLGGASSVQTALRLPSPDLAKAREIAARKEIGYQTLPKMLVSEGLQREARRQQTCTLRQRT